VGYTPIHRTVDIQELLVRRPIIDDLLARIHGKTSDPVRLHSASQANPPCFSSTSLFTFGTSTFKVSKPNLHSVLV